MVLKKRSTKNPPILSHEFIIQNHADIVACVAMVVVGGLMFQASHSVASRFISLRHNATNVDVTPYLYTSGPNDIAFVFFYSLILVVIHQLIQEYILDKINRKLHLSKVKHAQFNEFGHLLAFYFVSVLAGSYIIFKDNLLDIRSLWEGYPHTDMTSAFKIFFLLQIAYWIHSFPELYFQKIKQEEIGGRILYASVYLVLIIGAYVFSFTRVAMWLLVMHYFAAGFLHAAQLLSYSDHNNFATPVFLIHNVVFILSRIGTLSLAVLTFWYGLGLGPAEFQIISVSRGIYNASAFRLCVLFVVGILQAYLLMKFITRYLTRLRENTAKDNGQTSMKVRKTQQDKARARKDKAMKEARMALNEMTEVDQNTLRQRKK